MRKLGILLMAITFAATAQANIVDEVVPGGVPASKVGDRPMRDKISLQAIQAAFDDSDPLANVVRFKFHPDMTYKIRLREFMDTTVSLPLGEEINAYSIGDAKNFRFVPLTKPGKEGKPELKHLFRLAADYPGGDTNLSVVGKSGRIYSFYLRADSVQSSFLPALVVYIEAEIEKRPEVEETPEKGATTVLPGAPVGVFDQQKEVEYLRSLDVPEMRDIRYSYVMSGEKTLAPVKVFDDGVWTYFKFADENMDRVKRLPALYRVIDGVDSPVNTRVVDGTLVAETTSVGWTLRNGDSHLCIRRK
ncbi:TrbG/VirB9 family P-type conjugative transfer protein [Nitrosovibrio sp. Nv6]|uniref:TrbG/VirB9 family P-type conjugative transfer protein n=1 Tax=Nitrosovibrio sp. Nv6 TaxID=1855340 RepID=UPI0008BC2ADD|nr:TrbG/VirB9 family P-type conjugative transfer protein [Nitrosovibrio sp. Nv6]SEP43196.1 ComB9 competence protein [Nitrosovibrio sp. Nv6]